MKRIVLLLGLALLLALAACNGAQPDGEELLATTEAEGGMGTAVPVEATVAPMEEQIIPSLAGTAWEWVSLTTPVEQIAATDPTRYRIAFNDDGTANITADCNNVIATYVADETGALAITPGPSTLMACPEDTQDQIFLAALSGASNYFALSSGPDLYIDQMADAGTLRLRPATMEGETDQPVTVANLTDTTWEWVSLVDASGQTAASDPARYIITFNEDGTAAVVADCNNVVVQYLTDGANIEIHLGAATLMACPEGSQDQVYIAALSRAATYLIQDSELFLELEDDGTMLFRPAGSAAGPAGEAGETAAPALTGTRWEWVSTTTATETVTAADPARYAITFADDGTAGIVADCNVGNATYTAGDDGSLSIVLGVSTMAFCENSQDQVFRANLESAASYALEGEELVITLTDGGTMRFRVGSEPSGTSPAAPTLTGGTWAWVQTVTPVETIVAGDPTRYTITFAEDGTASIKADCNMVTASYTAADDGTIAITMGASTLAMCPEDSQATAFLNGLGAAAIYFFQDGHLFIDQMASAGTMEFMPAGEVAPSGSLTGETWQWVSVNTANTSSAIADPTRYTIIFNEDGTASIKADCNQGTATYTATDGQMTITLGAMTAAACAEASQDTAFLTALGATTTYGFQDGLLMLGQADGGSVWFEAAGEGTAEGGDKGMTGGGDLAGPTWQWTRLQTPASTTTVANPAAFTITFNADGTASLQADCNTGTATYTTDGSALTIMPGALTRAFCQGSLDQVFLGGLTNAMAYRMEGGELIIDLLYEQGSMYFASAQ